MEKCKRCLPDEIAGTAIKEGKKEYVGTGTIHSCLFSDDFLRTSLMEQSSGNGITEGIHRHCVIYDHEVSSRPDESEPTFINSYKR